MRKFAIITGSILAFLILLFFVCTDPVVEASYLNSDYYNTTTARIDSLEKSLVIRNDSILAGFAKVSITPKLNAPTDNLSEGEFSKVPLAGFGARKGEPATGIHDSIFVKAVALQSGNQTLVMVAADLLIMPPNIIDSVTFVLAQKGIRREQVYFSATHTHSSLGAWGPGFIGGQFAGDENKNIERWLVQQIAKTVTASLNDLKPATIGSGSFNAAPYTRNRVVGDAGTKNDDFSFIEVEQIGYKKAILGSYSAHSTTMGAGNMEISADYPGYWARKMEKTSFDYALFMAGSVGSQSPTGEGKGFDRPKMIGESLADSLTNHLQLSQTNGKVEFTTLSVRMQLPEYHMRLTTKLNLSTYLSKQLMPLPQNAYLQAVRIGNMVWISVPCDFSGEYALQIKQALAAKGFNANVTSFNGSYVGYIVPGKYFYLDEYEPKLMGWFGPTMGDYTMDLIHQITGIVTK
jgi:hypothetical protein